MIIDAKEGYLVLGELITGTFVLVSGYVWGEGFPQKVTEIEG